MEITENEVQIASDVLLEFKRIFPDEDISLFTTINFDLDTYGDDFDELVYCIDPDEVINWEEFEYTNHFLSENLIFEALFGLVENVFRLAYFVFVFPINRKFAKRIWKNRFRVDNWKRTGDFEPLYIGDIIVSFFYGKFTYMNNTKIDVQNLNHQAVKLLHKFHHLQ